MAIMIPRNTVFPCHRKHYFTTTLNNQAEFPVKIFEGESEKCVENEYLGSFVLDGLPRNHQAGSLKIEVDFDIDGNRNLTVAAYE